MIEQFKDDSGKLHVYAWPGGYPLYYVTADNGVMCPACAQMADDENLCNDPECPEDDQWRLIDCAINYEDDSLFCDHCNKRIQSAYGENGDD